MPPPPAIDLDLTRYYIDANRSSVDPAKEQALRAETAKLRAFLAQITKDADAAWGGASGGGAPRLPAALCGLAWLDSWANVGGYLGTMKTKQAQYQRKWDLAGLALAYIKLKRFAAPDQDTRIRRWLLAIASEAVMFQAAPERTRNNHDDWMVLGLAATAYVTENRLMWLRARRMMGQSLRRIGPDGLMASELARGTRALHYHVFALMPLVVAAEIAAAMGEDWYALEDGALNRMAIAVLAGIEQPRRIETRVGAAQERPVNTRAGWGWLYARRAPTGVMVASNLAEKTGHRLLGGDVRVLVRALGS